MFKTVPIGSNLPRPWPAVPAVAAVCSAAITLSTALGTKKRDGLTGLQDSDVLPAREYWVPVPCRPRSMRHKVQRPTSFLVIFFRHMKLCPTLATARTKISWTSSRTTSFGDLVSTQSLMTCRRKVSPCRRDCLTPSFLASALCLKVSESGV